MSSLDENSTLGEDEASSNTSEVPSEVAQGPSKPVPLSEDSDIMKRAAAKKLIERYFYQLLDGCGNANCDNQHCASNAKAKALTPNQAAAQAIHLFSQEARLCDAQPSKVARTSDSLSDRLAMSNDSSTSQSKESDGSSGSQSAAEAGHSGTAKNEKRSPLQSDDKSVPYITEEKLLKILETCKRESSYSLLIRTLGMVFSSADCLSRSFVSRMPDSLLDAILDKAPSGDLRLLKKEDMRALEGDLDKDEDSQEMMANATLEHLPPLGPSDTHVDLPSLRRAYAALFNVDGVESDVPNLERVLVQALSTLTSSIEISFHFGGPSRVSDEDLLHILIIVLELPVLGCSDYLEVALPKVCQAASYLPISAQARLARIWAKHSRDHLKELLVSLQQLVTLKVISGSFSREHFVQEDDAIAAATKLMKVVYYSSILAGEMDSPDLREEDPSALDEAVSNMNELDILRGTITGNKTAKAPQYEDVLGLELQVNVLDSRTPYVPFSDFYNEPLSDAVEMDQDFAFFKSDSDGSSGAGRSSGKFSFMRYAFILTPATKTLGLYYDNRVRMYNERRMSIFQTVVGQPTNPYLRLKIRRDHIIHDALVELEMVAMENPKDLKKQLVVEFEGEQGVDEGGVSKEFFQLIIEEIFKPDYGMFTHNQETETVWFNPTSFESDAQFKLIGILLGLAIYNNIILDIHFPMVVYGKLMGKRATFYDLEDWNKTLFYGLQSLLEYKEDDLEEAFMQTFRICYEDVFGTLLFHDLKENGDKLLVNKTNRQEFVELYADFLLNTSVEKQFRAFRLGFQMVTDESPLHLLFRPEEVEQLVCGSKNFDFNELEDATKYDGGYTSESPVVRYFWQIVHHMPQESKRKLLQFATGSDRVPVGGFSKLKLIIARNGPDSDRLPTAHTCYNVLLLPEYSSKEKLMDRLEKAINNSKGFGML